MKIYTKTGDEGETGLFGGGRVRKDHARIEAYGTVDELNAGLGVIRAEQLPTEIERLLHRIQNELFDLGAELATPQPGILPHRINAEAISALERVIDQFEQELPPLKNFILPAGGRGAALMHVSRTVCRRAERCVVRLQDVTEQPVAPEIMIYLNRLSDLLFVLARVLNARGGQGDDPWCQRGSANPA
ncbi:MAG: cob(I)yrinic acid a,c-diamide adenosyltransferase [Pirellulales bacterium]|nr:cob(I)yrinic acid a,c-diamide adenosyltransferase [Pirellulales bacterium]